jgi:hypothetical protein
MLHIYSRSNTGAYTVIHSRERGKEMRSKRDGQIMRILHSDGTVGVHKRQLREKYFRRVDCLSPSKTRYL